MACSLFFCRSRPSGGEKRSSDPRRSRALRGTGRAQRAGCRGVPAPGGREVALEPGSTGGPAPPQRGSARPAGTGYGRSAPRPVPAPVQAGPRVGFRGRPGRVSPAQPSPAHSVSSGGPRKVSAAGGCECQTPPVRTQGLRGGFLRCHGGGRRGSGRGSRQPARRGRLLWGVCCHSPIVVVRQFRKHTEMLERVQRRAGSCWRV